MVIRLVSFCPNCWIKLFKTKPSMIQKKFQLLNRLDKVEYNIKYIVYLHFSADYALNDGADEELQLIAVCSVMFRQFQ